MTLLYRKAWKGAAALAVVALAASAAFAVRVKDIAEVHGPMENPLVGTGLVVGLSGTGDDAKFAPSIKLLANMLSNIGAEALPTEVYASKNCAVVSVSAVLPKYNTVGDHIKVDVAAVGNAKSLQGGRLVLCPLLAPGPEGGLQKYAIAQGALKVGVNSPTTATIEDGGTVVRSVPAELTPGDRITFKLADEYADFAIATSIVRAIHEDLNIDTLRGDTPVALAVDAKTIVVTPTPEQLADPVKLISQLEWLSVPGISRDMEAKVVIDEGEGSFYAINGNVDISPVVVGYNGLQVEIKSNDQDETTTLDDLVAALRRLQATPADVIGLLKALEASGALHAKVIRQ